MPAVHILLLFVGIASPTSAIRRHRHRKHNISDAVAQSADCEALKNLTFRGKDIGGVAGLVCQNWPSRWGRFPIAEVGRAQQILEYGFAEGGLWDQMKELSQGRKQANFCWRDRAVREPATCNESMSGNGKDYKGCQWKAHTGEPCVEWPFTDYFWVGDHSFCRNPDRSRRIWCFTQSGRFVDCDPIGEERATTTTTTPCIAEDMIYKPDMLGHSRSEETSELACQKRCSLVSGCEHFSYWSWHGRCHLQNSSAKRASSWRSTFSGPPACTTSEAEQAPGSVLDTSSSSESMASSLGCQVFFNGRCYGGCPAGFQPAALMQFFAPVCSSRCADSRYPFGCGFGCASSRRDCVSTVTSQVTEVVSAVGKATAFLTGNQQVHKVVDTLIKLVEFTITTFWTLIRYAKQLWSQYKEAESFAAFMTIFGAFIQDDGQQVGRDLQTIAATFGELVGFWLEMVQEGFQFREAPLKFIINAFTHHGELILDSAYGLVSAFVYPKCT